MRLEHEARHSKCPEAPRQGEVVDDPRHDIGPDVDMRVVCTAKQITRSA
jgi:hypothetical protein